MPKIIIHRRGFAAMIVRVVAAALTLTLAGFAMAADPPMRVARLGYLTGSVTFSPAGENDWVSGTLNRPLVTGDRLWADNNGRAELQIGSAVVRLSASTLFALTNLDDRIAQMHLQQGTLLVRVRRIDRNQVVEIDTPNLALVISQPGEYRITVNAAGDSTEVVTRSGRAAVYDAGASYSVASGRGYRFFGAGLADYELVAMQRPDAFDRWAQGRDRSYDSSISARYVSRDVIGYQDLDQYGNWSSVPEYGNVWIPTRVAADWAPYRDGHWSWIEPWGWTWVDDQPWGFTVSHYGRWTNTARGWGWIPGPIAARPVYAPALVAFVGGSNFQVNATNGNVGAVGWFPLGPREVYRPAYAVSRNYFTSVNSSNTVISNAVVSNNYDNRNAPNISNPVYVNRAVRGAVVTVPTTAFVQSQPVARTQLRVSEAAMMQAPVNNLAVVAPQRISVLGAAPQQQKPPQVIERRVVAQSPPPAAAVGFAVRERALVANPGKPLEAAALSALKPAAPPTTTPRADGVVPAPSNLPPGQPRVEIVQPRALEPSAPPPAQPAARTPSDRRGNGSQPPAATPVSRDPNPVAPSGQVAPGPRPPAPAVPASPAPQEPVKPGVRPPEQRGQPMVVPPMRGNPPAQVQPTVPAQPQVTPPAQAAPPGQRNPGSTQPQLPPGESRNKPRDQRDAPMSQPAIPVAPPVPARNPAPVAQPPQSPAVAPVEPQRGRPGRPEPVKAVPSTPAVPSAAAVPPAPVVAEPAKLVSPPAKSEAGEQKPPVVEDKKDRKRGEKNGEKPDGEDDEKKRK